MNRIDLAGRRRSSLVVRKELDVPSPSGSWSLALGFRVGPNQAATDSTSKSSLGTA